MPRKNTQRATSMNKAIRSDKGPDPRGDVPHRARRTYVTSSMSLPRTVSMYTTRQVVDGPLISAVANTNVSGNFTFALNNLDQVTSFTGLFDQYRIDAIRISIVPQNNAIGLVTNTTTTLPSLYCVLDYDNATNLATAAAARQYDNCIELAPAESLERTFQPRLALAAYGGAFTSYGNLAPQWIDSASPGVIHFGVKYYVPAATAGQVLLPTWTTIIEYYVSFRSII